MIRDIQSAEIPYLDQYFGVWSCYEPIFSAGFDRISRMDIALHMQEVRAARMASGDSGWRKTGYNYSVLPGGIALVDISGTLMKQESSATNSTSTVMMRRTMRQLANDDDVAGVMIRFDSPGGTVAGTQDLADEIAALAAKKPVAAYVEDLCASAAYWLASMCDPISANKGLIGSIGTYSVVQDQSAAAAQQGVKVHVVRAGKFKGMGVPGTEVTADQLDEMQRIVDSLNEDFVSGVAKGRKMPAAKVADIADGRVHPSSVAKEMGLIDHVESFDAAMSRLRTRMMSPSAMPPAGPVQRPGIKPKNQTEIVPSQSDGLSGEQPGEKSGEQTTQVSASVSDPGGSGARASEPGQAADAADRKETSMSQPHTAAAGSAAAESKPASMKELKAACPGAPADFLNEQAENNATVAQAKDAFLEFQSAQLRARDEELAKLKEKKPHGNPPGGKPIKTAARAADGASGGSGAEATSEFDEAVRQKMADNKSLTRREAITQVARESPDLHKQYLRATNKPGTFDAIDDRFAA